MYTYYIIVLTLEKFSFWIILLGIIGVVQKRQQGELPEWRKRTLTKEQQALVNMQYQAYKKDIYKNYPRVEQFEWNKKVWAGCLSFLVFLAMVLNFSRVPATMFSIGVGIILCLFGYLIVFGVFATAMGPKRQYTFVLYVIAFEPVISFWRMMGSLGRVLDFFKYNIADFRYTPLQIGSVVLPLINGVLTLLTAVWLTAFKRNRELAQQSEELNTQINNDFTPTGI